MPSTASEAGSGTPVTLLSPLPLKPPLPKSVRPDPRSPPLVQLFEIVLESRVTAAFRAMARPQRIFAVVSRVTLWSARMFPQTPCWFQVSQNCQRRSTRRCSNCR